MHALRPRRPHHHAAGRGAVPRQAPQLRRHGQLHLPAGRRGRQRRRARHDRGRPVPTSSPATRCSASTTGRACRPTSSAFTPGPFMASSNRWDIVIRGVGGHAAQPHKGRRAGLHRWWRPTWCTPCNQSSRAAAIRSTRPCLVHHADPRGRRLQRDPRRGGAARHGAHLHAGRAGQDREPTCSASPPRCRRSTAARAS